MLYVQISIYSSIVIYYLNIQVINSLSRPVPSELNRVMGFIDEEVRARFVSHDADTGIHWPSTCYASYTSDQNIRYKTPSDAFQHTSRQKEVDVISSRTFRSAMAPVDWSKCFICKNKSHKKSRDLINLCTFEACESIRIAAERKGDSSMLHILNGVNGDLIAAEAKYHKNCFATYVSKKTTLSLPKGEALDSPHERAFKTLYLI